MKRLYLFDIDGTLIRSGGAGKRSFNKAFNEIFGIDNAFDDIPMHGMLDPIIFQNALSFYGIISNNYYRKFKKLYLKYLSEETKDISGWKVVEGVKSFLKKNQDNAFFALLTGNMYEGAKIKLEAVGLWDFFPEPEIGAFGDEAEERIHLGNIALKKIKKKRGIEFNKRDIVVFGDTQHDIAVAKHIGAQSVALSSGGISLNILQKYQPDYLAENFTELMNIEF